MKELVSVTMIVIYILYKFKLLKKVPCKNTFLTTLQSHFTHIEFTHLLSNLIGFYLIMNILNKTHSLSRYSLSKKDINIILVLSVFMNVLVDILYTRYFNTTCSIGFSSILFSLFTVALLVNHISILNVVMALLILLSPSFFNKELSVSGHIIGIISGFLVYFLWSKTRDIL